MNNIFYSPVVWGRIIAIVVRHMGRYIYRVKANYRAVVNARRWAVPTRFVAAMPDLKTVDGRLADEFYRGRFELGGHVVDMGGDSPFVASIVDEEWLRELHSFKWIRHATQTELNCVYANGLIGEWINIWGNTLYQKQYWEVELVAQRVIAWCAHCPAMMREHATQQNKNLMKNIVKQIRYLYRKADRAHTVKDRLIVAVAISVGVICTGQSNKLINKAIDQMNLELAKLVKDKCRKLRSPKNLVEVVGVLITMRALMQNRKMEINQNMQKAIEGMLHTLWQVRHENGQLAQFNGTGVLDEKYIETLFAFYNPSRKVNGWAGYEKLNVNKSVVIVDGGAPDYKGLRDNVFAGTAAFEFSSGDNRLVMNCGMTQRQKNMYLPFARIAAAHSSAIVDNNAAIKFLNLNAFRFASTPIDGARNVKTVKRSEKEYEEIMIDNDAYKRQYEILHKRILRLSQNGEMLEGRDGFTRVRKKHDGILWHLRFHIDPKIKMKMMKNNMGVALVTPDGEIWKFNAPNCAPRLEETIDFTTGKQSLQIVIENRLMKQNEVYWRFEKNRKENM